MADERRDFGEFYPGGGTQAYVPPQGAVTQAVAEVKARLDAVAAVAALEPDGTESLAEVKERVNAIAAAAAE